MVAVQIDSAIICKKSSAASDLYQRKPNPHSFNGESGTANEKGRYHTTNIPFEPDHIKNAAKHISKRKHKTALCLFLAVIFIFTLCVCGTRTRQSPYEQFITAMQELKEKGDNYSAYGMDLQAFYYYGVSGASISAMRLAVDHIISIKSGRELGEITGDAYDSFSTIASINYCSPYPYYFEGLIRSLQDDKAKAEECYRNALMNPGFPQSLSFAFFDQLSLQELNDIRQQLFDMEESIYQEYSPRLLSIPRDPMNFNDAYLRAKGYEVLKKMPDNTDLARQYYDAALSANPFEPKNFICQATLAIYTGNIERAVFYTNEGLWIAPNNKELLRIAELLG